MVSLEISPISWAQNIICRKGMESNIFTFHGLFSAAERPFGFNDAHVEQVLGQSIKGLLIS